MKLNIASDLRTRSIVWIPALLPYTGNSYSAWELAGMLRRGEE